MASPGLESSLCRGLVLRLVLDSSVLDDPELTTREKFVVVLNHLCPDDPIYFVMATSKLDRFKTAIHLAGMSRSMLKFAGGCGDIITPTDFLTTMAQRTAS